MSDLRRHINAVRRLDELKQADLKLSEPPPPPPREPRPRRRRDDDPQGGRYWVKDGRKIAITGKVNEIVNLPGQIMLLNPAQFGLTPQEVLAYLEKHSTDGAQEYRDHLAGKNANYDMTHYAVLWKASREAFRMLIARGWVVVSYKPPEGIAIGGSAAGIRVQFPAISSMFPMMQLDAIVVTEIAPDTDVSTGKYLHMANTRTRIFRREDFPGFAAAYGAASNYLETGQAPAHNYLYFASPYAPEDFGVTYGKFQLSAKKGTITIPVRGQRVRRSLYHIPFSVDPPPLAAGQHLYRVPKALSYPAGRGLSTVFRGKVSLYDDSWFTISPNDIEVQTPEGWKPLR